MIVPVFVYGTLRVGHGNYEWSKDAVVRSIVGCTTKGRIYFAFKSGGYPVAKLDEEGTIVGDLHFYDYNHPDAQDVHRMESGAGYLLREITVTDPEGNELDAYGWHYLYAPRGAWIENGDWASFLKSLT